MSFGKKPAMFFLRDPVDADAVFLILQASGFASSQSRDVL